jgi:hypothetical protein
MADFNGDGRPDLAVGGVTILLNISNGFVISTTTAVGSSSNPSSLGQSITFTSTVTPQTGSALPTGTVTFSDGSQQLGEVTLSAGAATLSTSALAVGSHSITVSYSGDSNFGASVSGTFTQVVADASTTTTLTATPNPANVGQSVVFTATVAPATSGVPTGTVSFFDGSTQLGASNLSGGVASFSTTSLAAASHNVTAVYSGDGNYNASSSTAMSEVVSAAGFNLSSTALSPTTISAGGSAQWTITINPSGGLNPSTVSLSCAVTPVVTQAVNCSVDPVSVSGGVGTSTLHVTTTTSHTNVLRADDVRSRPGRMFLLALLIPGACLGGFGIGNANRRKFLGLGIALLIISGCTLQTACGGSSTPATTTVAGTPQGSYTVTVTGSSGGMQQTTAVVITVQ